MEQNTSSDLFDLQVDSRSSSYLNETAKWAKFLSIIGFIFCGILLIVAVFAGSLLSGTLRAYNLDSTGSTVGTTLLSFIYVSVAVLYFIPCLFQYKFAVKMQHALRNNDQEQLTGSLQNLKSRFKFMGILTIVGLGFYALMIIFMIIGYATGSRM